MNNGVIKEEKEQEYYCLHCGDVFPANQLKVDILGNKQGCGSKKYSDCDGAGFSVDLHPADGEFAKGCLENQAIRAAKSKEELLKEYVDGTRSWYEDVLNSYSSKDAWYPEKVVEHVERFEELTSAQHSLTNYRNFVKRQRELGFFEYLQKETYTPEEFSDYMLHVVHKKEEDRESALKGLLAKKAYRNSFHFVMLELLDKEKVEKHARKHDTLVSLIESVEESEDAYKISRRAKGSAYSGKSQR